MPFTALIARETAGDYTVAPEQLEDSDLQQGEVLIDVAFSSLNYKDALAVAKKGRIIRRFPMVLGIDLAGTVVSSDSDEFRPGDNVLPSDR